jgi:hypothetical protein
VQNYFAVHYGRSSGDIDAKICARRCVFYSQTVFATQHLRRKKSLYYSAFCNVSDMRSAISRYCAQRIVTLHARIAIVFAAVLARARYTHR